MRPEAVQEEEYDFPYHHLVGIRPFMETRHLFWGYKYAAYLEKVLDALKDVPFRSLIEIGCGDGKVLHEIERRYPGRRYVGTDYSEKSLRFARAFSPHLEFMERTQEKFDAFVLVEVLEHIDPMGMEAFLDSICANLNPGARGIITTPCDNVPVNPKHYQHFNRESIERTLGRYFVIDSFEYTSARTFGTVLIQRLLANRLFILNHAGLVGWLYRLYKARHLSASARTATQVFVMVTKR